MAVQHTMVPYMWRRHLGIVRALLGGICLTVYTIYPVRYGVAIAVIVALYTGYAILHLIRDSIESNLYPLSMLMLDGMFFLLCAMHPSEQALWLCTVAYFYVLTFSALLYEWWHVCSVVGASIAFFAIFRPSPTMWLWPAIVLGGVLSVVLALHKHSFQDRLSAALRRSVISRSEAETARESERQRIAADFHDGPLQSFISFQMRLEIIRKLLERDTDAAMRELVQLQDLGRAQVTELRAFVRGMQPADVSPSNLQSAIREAVEHFERDSGIAATLICGDPSILEEGAASEFLQIVREALNNVRKHSKASQVSIVIESGDDGVDMIVEDDGSGFPFSGAYSLDELEILRLGPRSIKRRVRTLGGDLTIQSRPLSGSVIRVHIPA
ncbi:MAG TPA: sensor histidine kinase [Bryobacteraceae bacterium]|nr:sensor histidine kinase [Bryobacteraceae bacterium]